MHLNSSPVLPCKQNGMHKPTLPINSAVSVRGICNKCYPRRVQSIRSYLCSCCKYGPSFCTVRRGRVPSRKHNTCENDIMHEPARHRTPKSLLTESNIIGIHHNIKAEKMPTTTHMAYVPPVAYVLSFVCTFFLWQCGHSGRVAGYDRPSFIPERAAATSAGVAVPHSTSPDASPAMVFFPSSSSAEEKEKEASRERRLIGFNSNAS